jgi:DNA-binding NtrC family response regulator
MPAGVQNLFKRKNPGAVFPAENVTYLNAEISNKQAIMKNPVVVVVDRNPVHRNLINYNLVIHKFLEVHTFLSWDECLYRMQKSLVPDFVITDLGQSIEGGLGFLAKVRELAPDARVIFFAAFPDRETAHILHEAGAADYIPKSNKPDLGTSELIRNIRYLTREKAVS